MNSTVSPIGLNNSHLQNLNEVKDLFFEFLDIRAEEYNLSETEVDELKAEVNNYFTYRKLQYLTEAKLRPLYEYIDDLFKVTIEDQNNTKKDKGIFNFFHVKNSKRLMRNE